MTFKEVTLKPLVKTEKLQGKGKGSSGKKKRAESGKTALSGRPWGIVLGFCLVCMVCTAAPASLDKDKSPDLGCLCHRGTHQPSDLPPLPCPAQGCPVR